MYVRSLSKKSWNLVEVVDCAGVGAVSGFLADLGANKKREATRMTALFDRVAVHGPRQGTAKCHQIQGEIWEFIHGSLRVLFAHDGNQLILCTSGFVKKSRRRRKEKSSAQSAPFQSFALPATRTCSNGSRMTNRRENEPEAIQCA